MNIAWDHFANDVGDTAIDEAKFLKIMEDIQAAGGNSLRLWLSTNAANDPKFDSATGLVKGLGSQTINNVKKILDMAAGHGIVMSMCLLSFDLLQTGETGVNPTYNLKLLETDAGIQAYIDNALLPLVKAIGNHPGLLCWEIFNEPEGMCSDIPWGGWSTQKTTVAHVQRFINKTVGAIHRAVPGVYVSSSSWCAKAMTDVPGFINYYTDAKLIGAGGDADGKLDFYQLHYYDNNFNIDFSPFHHDLSYWKLDKPVLIGEFSAEGLIFLKPKVSIVDCYTRAYNGGYAGAFAWNYPGFNTGNYSTCKPAMQNIYNLHTDTVKLK
jgi:hypothetical protein